MASLTASDVAAMLDDPSQADAWFSQAGVNDQRRGHENILRIAHAGVPFDLLAIICRSFASEAALISDPDMALNNLERFILSSRSPLSLAALFERDTESLPILLQILSTSQYLSDLLIQQPEIYDLLRISEGMPVSREVLIDELLNEMAIVGTDAARATDLLRTFKQRETARIIYGDIVKSQRIETVTRQISHVADTICEAAVVAASGQLQPQFGQPKTSDGHPCQFVVLALGKLGGQELNYSSDIDLIFFYDGEGQTDGARAIQNCEYFDHLARRFVKMMTESTALGTCYRVDLRLRPNGSRAPVVISREAALRYYDLHGRTWERQAFVKARAIAGDLELGEAILETLTPWIYRRYLSRADIAGIKTLKRKIEQRTSEAGHAALDVKSGTGGIRDIEFVIQFLQLLNGGDLESIRTGNTLEAIIKLEETGCLTMQERSILEENYGFLRKIEHRLQIMFDMQTHTLPEGDDELRKLAIRMGYAGPSTDPLEQFKSDLSDKTELNRKILNHLLHDAFPKTEETSPEVDLILSPAPDHDSIQTTLTSYGFENVTAAFGNLTELAHETVPFLSTRRCRHFLAAIAPRLLTEIARTPDPDQTLLNLNRVSESLGGKGALWELFSSSQPSMQLYVRLCASSPYLSSILTSNPGMIDELMDSLVRNRLPTADEVFQSLVELTKSAEDIDPILHSFKHSMHLRVGVRDILDKEDIVATTNTLSHIAEACVQQVTLREYKRMVAKYGMPSRGDENPARTAEQCKPSTDAVSAPLAGDSCELIILGLGKLGGCEPNYHSDLDVIFLYECDGVTRVPDGVPSNSPIETTSNQHFFTELGQRIIRRLTHIDGLGRLYEMDPRLRPTGKNGALAVSLEEFRRYFADGNGQLWERQALCKARPLFGSAAAREKTMERVRNIIMQPAWQEGFAGQIYEMRLQMQKSAADTNLKRGVGGTVDVEFIVQLLQMKHAAKHPDVVVPGTLAAIAKLKNAHLLTEVQASDLDESYRFLRRVESRLRLMNTTARHDLPDSAIERERLAYLMGSEWDQLVQQCETYRQRNREMLVQLSNVKTGV